jgi:hypothetical protein
MPRLLLVAFVAGIATIASSCGSCDSGSLTQGRFLLSVDKSSIEFGDIYIGASSAQIVTLHSEGSLAITYASTFVGNAWGFEVGPAIGGLAPNGSVPIQIKFAPGTRGHLHPLVVFTGKASENGKTASVAVQLSGTGVLQPDCDDGNGCTVDAFNLASQQCEHMAARLPCDDFDACTTGDTCVNGMCLGQPLSCDDHNVCTDDLCDRERGCVYMPAMNCDDGNPCTADTCDPMNGCQHTTQPDGSPCSTGRLCVFAEICILGQCMGVNAPDGSPCDDGDPCSKHDQCVMGICEDPTYHKPAIGEIKFATDVGPLADGASSNPIIDRDSSVFVGIEGGVAAVDQCGAIRWTNAKLGASRFSAAVSLPGLLVLPVGAKLVEVDLDQGRVLRTLDLAPVFGSATSTASMAGTATTSVRILDLALHASGGIIASLVLERVSTQGAHTFEGMIAEIDPLHINVAPFRHLGPLHASRLAIDTDEGVVAILRAGEPDKGVEEERLVRFGLDNLPETSWSTNPVLEAHGELAFSGVSDVLWTAGLIRVGRNGQTSTLLSADPDASAFIYGSPVLTLHDVILARPVPPGSSPSPNLRAAPTASAAELIAIDPLDGSLHWQIPLDGDVHGMSPAADLQGNTYVVTSDGVLHGFVPGGVTYFDAPLPISSADLDHVALGISPDGVVVAVARGRVFGVQSMGTLGSSAWPKHRRDNLATGHR